MTMDRVQREQLYNSAWKHWGAEFNLDVCIEELAELIHAIIGTRRQGVTYSYAFSEELADVLICLEQIEVRMKQMPYTPGPMGTARLTTNLWDGQVMEIKEQKLRRLKEGLMESMANDIPDGFTDRLFDKR